MGEQTLTGLAIHPAPAGAMPPVARSRGLGVVDLDSLTTELLAVIEQAMQPWSGVAVATAATTTVRAGLRRHGGATRATLATLQRRQAVYAPADGQRTADLNPAGAEVPT